MGVKGTVILELRNILLLPPDNWAQWLNWAWWPWDFLQTCFEGPGDTVPSSFPQLALCVLCWGTLHTLQGVCSAGQCAVCRPVLTLGYQRSVRMEGKDQGGLGMRQTEGWLVKTCYSLRQPKEERTLHLTTAHIDTSFEGSGSKLELRAPVLWGDLKRLDWRFEPSGHA